MLDSFCHPVYLGHCNCTCNSAISSHIRAHLNISDQSGLLFPAAGGTLHTDLRSIRHWHKLVILAPETEHTGTGVHLVTCHHCGAGLVPDNISSYHRQGTHHNNLNMNRKGKFLFANVHCMKCSWDCHDSKDPAVPSHLPRKFNLIYQFLFGEIRTVFATLDITCLLTFKGFHFHIFRTAGFPNIN